jgi:hypothetical protein
MEMHREFLFTVFQAPEKVAVYCGLYIVSIVLAFIKVISTVICVLSADRNCRHFFSRLCDNEAEE